MAESVDIHSHILWGLDDGAQDLETSLEMLQAAAEGGTTDIVATPHCNLRYSFDPEIVASRIQELRESPGVKPKIHTGCDFHLSFDNIEDCLENPTKYTINHLRYLMVEFSDINIPNAIGQVFERMLEAGITPVITHPERNRLLMGNVERIVGWIQAGCRVQVTAQSFLGRFGKAAQAAVGELMARQMVHFVASDAHDVTHRPPGLALAYETLARRYGTGIVQQLFQENPAATLTGEVLSVPDPLQPPRRRWNIFSRP